MENNKYETPVIEEIAEDEVINEVQPKYEFGCVYVARTIQKVAEEMVDKFTWKPTFTNGELIKLLFNIVSASYDGDYVRVDFDKNLPYVDFDRVWWDSIWDLPKNKKEI